MIVAVGYPSRGMVHDNFAISLCHAGFVTGLYKELPMPKICTIGGLNHREPISFALIKQSGPIQQRNRHRIVKSAKELKAERLIFVDTDMSFPADAFIRLLLHRKDIVGIDCVRSNGNHERLALDMNGKPFTNEKGLQEASRIAGGMFCVDMEVFDKIGEPYFDAPWKADENDWWSVDFHFFHRAREAGYKLWCDLDLSRQVGHAGTEFYSIPKDEK